MSEHAQFGPGEGDQLPEYSPVTRLADLTNMGRLHWTMVYPSEPVPLSPSDDALAAATQPAAYRLDDAEYGFGVVLVWLADRMNESFEPAVYQGGTRLEASSSEVQLLVDTIRVYFEEVQDGVVPTEGQRIHRIVLEAVEPFRAEIERLQADVAATRATMERQLDVMRGQVIVADKLATLLLLSSGPEDAELPGELSPEALAQAASSAPLPAPSLSPHSNK